MENTNKRSLLTFLLNEFPSFASYWEAEDNYCRDGDAFTDHGVCAQFSAFFKEHAHQIDGQKLIDLFRYIEEIVACDPQNQNDTANALCTCFLENIAQTEAGALSRNYMGKASRNFFDQWDRQA